MAVVTAHLLPEPPIEAAATLEVTIVEDAPEPAPLVIDARKITLDVRPCEVGVGVPPLSGPV